MLKINIKNIFQTKIIALGGLFALLLLSVVGPVSAQDLNQGYTSNQSLQRGMLVKEKDDDHSKAEPVTQGTLNFLKGVVVQKNDSPLTLSSEGQTIFVASSGVYDTLVNDENGRIKSGDYVSISSLAGIGMKANTTQSIALGKAVESFDGNARTISTATDPNTHQTVNIGLIKVAISIDKNPWKIEKKQNNIPSVLESVSTTIAGKKVSAARVWLALVMFLGTIIIVGVMLYGGARSGIISVGRNPLSKNIIMKGLSRVVLWGLVVFIFGLFGVYLLLKL